MVIEKKANTSNIRDIRSGQKVREGTSRARSGERERKWVPWPKKAKYMKNSEDSQHSHEEKRERKSSKQVVKKKKKVT